MAKHVTRVTKATAYWNILVRKWKEDKFTHYLKEGFWNANSGFAEVLVKICHKRWLEGGGRIYLYLCLYLSLCLYLFIYPSISRDEAHMMILFGFGEGNLWERPRELAGGARFGSCLGDGSQWISCDPCRLPLLWIPAIQKYRAPTMLLTLRWHQKTKQVWHLSHWAFNLVKENRPRWQSTKPPPRRLATEIDSPTQGRQTWRKKHPPWALESRGVWPWPHPPWGPSITWQLRDTLENMKVCEMWSGLLSQPNQKRAQWDGYFASQLESKAQSFLCYTQVCVGWRKYLFY